MTSRDRTVLAAVGLLALVAVAWLLVLAPQRQAASRAEQDAVSARARLSAARALDVAPTEAKADLADQIVVARLGKAVPTDVNVPGLIVQLQDVARRSHVSFDGLTLGQGSASTQAPAAGTATTSTTASTTTTSGDTATTPTGAATTATTPAGATPPGAVVDAAGYTTLPLQLRFGGRYLDLQRAFARMDGLVRVRGDDVSVRGRLLTVQSIALTPDEHSGLQAAVEATAYLAPEDRQAVSALMGGPATSQTASQLDAAAIPAATPSAGASVEAAR